jgi:hypothetical protein
VPPGAAPSRRVLWWRAYLVLAVTVLSITDTSRVHAQDSTAIAPGDRIRVTLPPAPGRSTLRRRTGTLILLAPSELRLQVRSDTVRWPLDSLVALEVSRGRAYGSATAPLVGGAIGLLAGFLIGHHGHPLRPESTSGEVVATTMAGGLLGVAAGAVIGSQIVGDRWVEIPLPGR